MKEEEMTSATDLGVEREEVREREEWEEETKVKEREIR